MTKKKIQKDSLPKRWYESRVVWLAVGQILLGGLLALKSENSQLADGGIVAAIIAMIQIALRFDTTRSIK